MSKCIKGFIAMAFMAFIFTAFAGRLGVSSDAGSGSGSGYGCTNYTDFCTSYPCFEFAPRQQRDDEGDPYIVNASANSGTPQAGTCVYAGQFTCPASTPYCTTNYYEVIGVGATCDDSTFACSTTTYGQCY